MDADDFVILASAQGDLFLIARICGNRDQNSTSRGEPQLLDRVLVKAGTLAHHMHKLAVLGAARVTIIRDANCISPIGNAFINARAVNYDTVLQISDHVFARDGWHENPLKF